MTDSSTSTTQDYSLLDLLDRLLSTGVVVRGDIAISVADIDLIYLRLNLMLASVSKLVSIDEDVSISVIPAQE